MVDRDKRRASSIVKSDFERGRPRSLVVFLADDKGSSPKNVDGTLQMPDVGRLNSECLPNFDA